MSENAGKRRNIYVDYLAGRYRNCLIHGHMHSSDECEVLGDFGSKYVKIIPTKDLRNDPVPRNKCNRKKENNDFVNSAVDEILLHENEKVSAAREAHENVDSDFDDNKIYQIDNMSLEETKEKLE